MTFRSIAATLLAALFATALGAQDNCPYEHAKHIPAKIDLGPKQECGGFSYRIGDLQVTSPGDSCPLWILYTPAHEIPESSSRRTQVASIGTANVVMITFRCVYDYFLFISIGSACVADPPRVIGVEQRLRTVGCPMTTPDA
jgi:hypothetical protein